MTMMNLEHPEHPIVRIEGSLVYFDTGSPQSLIPDVNAPWIESLGAFAPPMSGIAKIAFERSQGVLLRLTGGLRIDALVGMDLIAEHGLRYDLLNRQLGWGLSEEAVDSATLLKSELVMGLPVIEMEVAGLKMRAILDTGCHTGGYLLDLPQTLPDAGTICDESPMFGFFESVAWYAEASVFAEGGSRIKLGRERFGEAPPVLEFAMRAAGVNGVVGPVALMQAKSQAFAGSTVCVDQSL
jgi:hypothetical protein